MDQQHVIENKGSAEAAYSSNDPFVASADPGAVGGWQVTQGGVVLRRNIPNASEALHIAKSYDVWRSAVREQLAPKPVVAEPEGPADPTADPAPLIPPASPEQAQTDPALEPADKRLGM